MVLVVRKKKNSRSTFQKILSKEMNNQTLHRDRKHFCRYCLQSFSTAQILERHVSNCFDINIKQMIKMAKTGETVKFMK